MSTQNPITTPTLFDMNYNKEDGRVLFNMNEIIAVMWRRKWVIFGFALFGLCFSIWHAYFRLAPLYGSDAQIVVETRDEQILDLEKVLSGLSTTEEALQTENLILSGRRLMGLVVDKLDLTRDPEFNPSLLPASSNLMSQPKSWVKARLQTVVPANTQDLEISQNEANLDVRAQAVSLLNKKVTIRNIPRTYAFSIWVVTQDPHKSQRIANAIAETYIEDQLNAKFEATAQATQWLSKQVGTLEVELSSAEQKLIFLSNENDFVTPEEIASYEFRIVQLRRALRENQSKVLFDESNLLRILTAKDPQSREIVAQDLGFSTNRADQVFSESDWSQVAAAAQEDLDGSLQQVSFISQSVGELEAKIKTQTDVLSDLKQIEEDTASKRLFYESLRERLQETSIQTGLQRADSRITSRAALLRNPIAPKKGRLLTLGLFFGAALGAGLVLVSALMHPKVTSASRLSALTNLPVLASLPKFPFTTRIKRVPIPDAATPSGEAVRGLRIAIQMMKPRTETPPQIILLTSCTTGEGKTTLSTALAASVAKTGRKALLIDCDTRRCSASLRLGRDAQFSVIDVLHGVCDLNDAIVRTEFEGLDILPATTRRAKHHQAQTQRLGNQGLEALNRTELDTLLSDARDSWDIIVLDTPPVMIISDTLLLAERADVSLLVTAYNETSEADLELCLNRMRQLGQSPDGIIINKSNMQREIYGRGRRVRKYFGKQFSTSET